ncbi:unnamed protein product [Linum trigynum]|uniref:Uncharacterized protein n=1 Tax=Linum trigynum TaxID=586398 RepID=A0AAV2FQD4_9ROSI
MSSSRLSDVSWAELREQARRIGHRWIPEELPIAQEEVMPKETVGELPPQLAERDAKAGERRPETTWSSKLSNPSWEELRERARRIGRHWNSKELPTGNAATAEEKLSVVQVDADGEVERRAEQSDVEEVLVIEPPTVGQPPSATNKQQQRLPTISTAVSKVVVPSAGKVESCAEERQPNLDLGEAFQVNPSTTSILLKTPINGKINWKSRKRKLRLDEAESATDEGERPEAGYYRSSLDSSHRKISTPRKEPPELEMKKGTAARMTKTNRRCGTGSTMEQSEVSCFLSSIDWEKESRTSSAEPGSPQSRRVNCMPTGSKTKKSIGDELKTKLRARRWPAKERRTQSSGGKLPLPSSELVKEVGGGVLLLASPWSPTVGRAKEQLQKRANLGPVTKVVGSEGSEEASQVVEHGPILTGPIWGSLDRCRRAAFVDGQKRRRKLRNKWAGIKLGHGLSQEKLKEFQKYNGSSSQDRFNVGLEEIFGPYMNCLSGLFLME